MSEKLFPTVALALTFIGVALAFLRITSENDHLRSENACLIRAIHIGSAAFATIGKDGHAHTVYRWEDCTK